MRVHYLPPSKIVPIYEEIRPLLLKALEEAPEYNEIAILASLFEETRHLFVVRDGAEIKAIVVTQFKTYPCCKTLLIHLIGGEGVHEWIHLIDNIEEFARNQRASKIEITGRKGWKKLLKDYQEGRTCYSKDLQMRGTDQ